MRTTALLGVLAAALVVAAAWWSGDRHGAGAKQAEWDRERAAAAEALHLARMANAREANAAAARFEAYRGRSAAALVTTRAELRNALQRPICPLAGAKDSDHALQLADVPIPAAAVDRLRRAAAGGGSP